MEFAAIRGSGGTEENDVDRTWGFEEADDLDERPPAEGEESESFTDPGRLVAVVADESGHVVSVRLVGDWLEPEHRRGLGSRVAEAANAATASAIAKQASEPDTDADPPDPPTRPGEQEPLTTEHVLGLLEKVSSDLARFRQRASAAVEETVTSASAGGHVTVSGRRRHIGEVAIDQDWLYRARAAEVESELRDALRAFGSRSSPGELAGGPRSEAISELLALVADPQAMVSRIRRRTR